MASCGIVNAKTHQTQEKMDYAFKQCLDHNYIHTGSYQKQDLNDFSYPPDTTTIEIEQRLKLNDFVIAPTGNVYTEQEMMHLESSKDRLSNKIFEKCMTFYHSQKLDQFIRNLKN